MSYTDSVGVGIRTVRSKKIGFASVTSLDAGELKEAVSRALAAAKSLPAKSEWKGLAEPQGRPSAQGTFDSKIATMTPTAMAETVLSVIDAVGEVDSRAGVARGSLSYGVEETAIANSHGIGGTSRTTAVSFDVNVSAEDSGKKGTAWEWDSQTRLSKADPLGSAKKAATEAVNMLNAAPPPTGETSVIFSDRTMAHVLGVMFSDTVTADSVQQGRSPWAGKVGTTVAQEGFRLKDDGRLKDGLATRPLDAEGVPQRTTPIIAEGELRGFLYDDFYAKKEGRSSTGNARRYGGLVPKPFARPPKPRTTNLVLEKGDATLDEMLRETRNGVYVTSTIGEWLSNPISGQLNATISSGYLVKNGSIVRPIKRATLQADFFSMINGGIELLGSEQRNSGSIYAVPVRAKGVTISGE